MGPDCTGQAALERTATGNALAELCMTGRTGRLECSDGRHTKRVYLIDGMVSAFASNDPADDLGHWLEVAGLDRDAIVGARQIASRDGRALLDILVGLEFMTPAALDDATRRCALAAIEELLLWETADTRYVPDELPDDSPTTVVASIDATEILELIDDSCWVRLVAAQVLAGEAPFAAAAAKSNARSTARLAEVARSAMERGHYDDAVALFQRASLLAPADARLRGLRLDAEEFYCMLLGGAELPLDAQLHCTVDPQAMADLFRPLCYRLLGRMDGSTTIRELIDNSGAPRVQTMKTIVELSSWGIVSTRPDAEHRRVDTAA